jgi:hypothetical protein
MQSSHAPLLPRHGLPTDVVLANNPFLVQPRPAAASATDAPVVATKLIPRIIWIAVKDRKDALPSHLTAFFARNPTWAVHVCDNQCKDHFMTTAFGNTSLAWAYYAINPLVGAARADSWRYCVLYSFGGVYLDDDSDIGVPLDQVVQPTDHMILSEEGPSSLGECYVPSYHLSDASTFSPQRFGANATRAPFYSPPALVPQEDLGVSLDSNSSGGTAAAAKTLTAAMITKTGVHVGPVYPLFFHGNTLVNWGLFVKARHPALLRTLHNIVEVIASEYSRRTVLQIARWDIKWKLVMCATNFVMTNTLREMALENGDEFQASKPRIVQNNFAMYRGRVKAIWTGNDPSHYMKLMTREGGPHLLKEHAPMTQAAMVELLHGQPVIGDAPDKAIYLILNGTRRMFPDYDTFLSFNFTSASTRHLKNKVLWSLPQGPTLPSVNNHAAAATLTTTTTTTTTKTTTTTVAVRMRRKERMRRRRLLSAIEIGTGYVRPPLASAALLPHDQLAPGKVQLRLGTFPTINATNTLTPLLPPPASPATADATTLHVTDKYLAAMRLALDNGTRGADRVTCWGDDYTGSRDDFLNDRHKTLLGADSPVLVYPMCFRLFQLGNTLGYYFNDVACADASGAHFLGVQKSFALILPEALATPWARHHTFFEALPYQLAHVRPLSVPEVKKKMREECRCLQYCWENSVAPWIPRAALVRAILLPAIDAYLAVANTSRGTILSNVTDLCSVPIKALAASDPGNASAYVLPIVPDVAIQYRCGDNIGFGKTRYGLLPFRALTARIPASARHIYVLADSPLRMRYHAYSSRCSDILQALFRRLRTTFPRAVVVVKRGGDQFLDYARLAYANVTICSASTFCLWPAIANPWGQAHFPLTPLAAGSGSNATAKAGVFGKHFHWIRDVEMLKEFKHFRPWAKILDVLDAV